MKRLAQLFSTLVFLTVVTSTNLSATTVLCSAGPTVMVAGNNAYETLYTCTIPANTLSLNGSLRVTANLSSNVASGNHFNTRVTLNGVPLYSTYNSNQNEQAYWDLVIVNTGPSTGSAGGFLAFTFSISTALHASVSGLSWGSSQALQIQFSCSPSFAAQGITLRVEAN